MPMPLLFHIIYTQGTVATLLFLAESLLRWSDCRLRLVANGCDEAEVALLQQFAELEPRVSWEALPTKRIMMHGDALNYLQARCAEPYFCFLDSDLYARGPFLEDFIMQLNHCAALFSGATVDEPPNGCRFEPPQKVMSGRFSHTHEELCLGSTYFAIYDQAQLTALMQQTGLSFKKYKWAELPTGLQQQLTAARLQCELYEPGKVLNLLLQWGGARLAYQPCVHLRHLGGVSRYTSLSNLPWDVRVKLRVKLMLQGEFRAPMKFSFNEVVPYCGAVLGALDQGRPLPAPPATANASLLHQVAQELADSYAASRLVWGQGK